ncbi:hypothetical protein LVD17_08175 [Fulvivirga ulvae]|uniref:hypothetical protein n=1 Tax=Fulvivirga ulvae TaxID=2904245 RepID=UPI001F225D71|nr:hypothetical protein [Fulvivirga ulvae]UII33792.1 hypothetical protein LVD17_08175 [Fulvivirga ulvae]
MRDRSVKYIASILLLVSACIVNPLAAQEGSFMFHEGGGDNIQEKPEAPSSPGTENSYTQPGLKSTYSRDKNKSDTQEKPEESNKQKPAAAANVQVQVRQTTTSPTTGNNEEEDPDSVLSFNFLHYIIQRFKFSEVIDE